MSRTPFAAALLMLSPSLFAAVPASGTLSDAEPVLSWTGDAPFVFPNVTPASGEPQCLAAPVGCDNFALTVEIGDEFRAEEANKKETVRFTVSWPNASGTGDFDVYLYDANDNLIGEAATSANPEIIVVPMSILKNGAYRFMSIPFLPLGDNYTTEATLGKKKSAGEKALSVTPSVSAPGVAVRFDARSLASAAPAGGYAFSFGDGTQLTDADGVVEHTYQNNGAYLARVRFTDPSGQRGQLSAAQTVVVQDELASVKGSSLLAGSFGLGGMLGLFALSLLRRRI